ncbi:iron uptake porin [Phormidium sp. FACHB-592]|uniref:Iron uptake porin n=1 Tax=Stenomitos frigidus AS-A4 TaxID=2933935 RepID=A0ABV0KMA9_9CYAN|nr:iron uptake porin [Phormidium sp. FACHB-592]MBD2072478.1 iron uptake porin [Phormidium sp. FACHB-592]
MSNLFLKSLLVSPAVLAAALAVSTSAIATEAKATNDVVQSQASALQPLSLAAAPQIAAPEVSASDVAPIASDRAVTSLEPKALPASVEVAQAAPAASEPALSESPSNSLNQINRYTREGRTSNAQVTSVSQLSDVQPTDWAFQALQSLVERYGCIAGYPDRTYRGNRATTRYEFAAGLNACLDRVNELIAAGTADLVKKEDLAVLQKLQEEFAAELATLRGRVDSLEARTATLEKQQFSTTTKLSGEVIFAITDEFGQPRSNETVFQDRVRLALNTSFTGKDLLVTRLAAGNFRSFNLGDDFSGVGLQTFQFGSTNNNQVFADWVAYYFPLGEKISVYVPAFAGLQYDYAPTQSGLMEGFDGGSGPLSVFAQRNPIYNIGGGSGLGVNFDLTNNFKISLGYLADNSTLNAEGGTLQPPAAAFGANNPAEKNGLFNGSYSALAQVAFNTDFFSIGLTYVNAYRRGAIFDTGSGGAVVGTSLANLAFLNPNGTFTSSRVNAYGISGSINLGRNISVNAFGSYIEADKVGDGFDAGDIWTYGIGLAFADFGKKGNLLGLMAGVEPYLGNSQQLGRGTGNSEPIHLEAFYRYQLTDNISITPGVIYVINPGQVNNSSDIFIGTLRTTFTF